MAREFLVGRHGGYLPGGGRLSFLLLSERSFVSLFFFFKERLCVCNCDVLNNLHPSVKLSPSTPQNRKRKSTPKEEKQRLKELSKCIKKCIRDKKRVNRQQLIQRILEDFKGVNNIPGIKSAKKKVLITKIKNERGAIITSRKGIANVFGEFYLTDKSVRVEMKAALTCTSATPMK